MIITNVMSLKNASNLFQGRIFYEVVGDYPAPSFFSVQNETGAISVAADLRTDNLGLVSYIVSHA